MGAAKKEECDRRKRRNGSGGKGGMVGATKEEWDRRKRRNVSSGKGAMGGGGRINVRVKK